MKEKCKIDRKQMLKNGLKKTYVVPLGWTLEHIRPTSFFGLEINLNGAWEWITSFGCSYSLVDSITCYAVTMWNYVTA